MSKKDLMIIIPARSGSKGLKDKNIFMFKGKPLIMHTFDYLIEENHTYDQIIISTDSTYYMNLLKEYGVPEKCFLLRPTCIAEDNVVDYPVVLNAWAFMESKRNQLYKYIALLRPTSPFRPKGLIYDGLNILKKDSSISSVRAMRKVSEHPFRVWKKIDDTYVEPLINDKFEPGNIPRQLLEEKYMFQSGELEIFTRETLQSGSISGSRVAFLEMKEINPDIDSVNDF